MTPSLQVPATRIESAAGAHPSNKQVRRSCSTLQTPSRRINTMPAPRLTVIQPMVITNAALHCRTDRDGRTPQCPVGCFRPTGSCACRAQAATWQSRAMQAAMHSLRKTATRFLAFTNAQIAPEKRPHALDSCNDGRESGCSRAVSINFLKRWRTARTASQHHCKRWRNHRHARSRFCLRVLQELPSYGHSHAPRFNATSQKMRPIVVPR